MDKKKYPTRMHEVLGVEPMEEFSIEDFNSTYCVDHEGFLIRKVGDVVYEAAGDIAWAYAINVGIIRKPRLSEEQVEQLRACIEWFDLKWLAKQEGGTVMAFENKPQKKAIWLVGKGYEAEDYGWVVKENSPICSLVSWSDPEPLDIVRTLKAAGVEVEG